MWSYENIVFDSEVIKFLMVWLLFYLFFLLLCDIIIMMQLCKIHKYTSMCLDKSNSMLVNYRFKVLFLVAVSDHSCRVSVCVVTR